jgi:hypothetical protein
MMGCRARLVDNELFEISGEELQIPIVSNQIWTVFGHEFEFGTTEILLNRL